MPAPAFLTARSFGEKRIVIDYRKLNKVLRPDPFPQTNADEIFLQLHGAKLFSVLDLKKGYYQIPLLETARPLTSFVIPQGQYQFKRLPLGLATATKIFSRLMLKHFGDIHDVHIYLDDIIIASRSLEDHVETLELVFQRARFANLTLNLDKS